MRKKNTTKFKNAELNLLIKENNVIILLFRKSQITLHQLMYTLHQYIECIFSHSPRCI